MDLCDQLNRSHHFRMSLQLCHSLYIHYTHSYSYMTVVAAMNWIHIINVNCFLLEIDELVCGLMKSLIFIMTIFVDLTESL